MINYSQIVEQTYEEKLAMYMAIEKEELAKMLIECNRILESLNNDTPREYGKFPDFVKYTVYGNC